MWDPRCSDQPMQHVLFWEWDYRRSHLYLFNGELLLTTVLR